MLSENIHKALAQVYKQDNQRVREDVSDVVDLIIEAYALDGEGNAPHSVHRARSTVRDELLFKLERLHNTTNCYMLNLDKVSYRSLATYALGFILSHYWR